MTRSGAGRGALPGAGPATVLALRALGLGDLLCALPALRGLRRSFPAARLVLATPAWLEPIARLSGTVDAVLDTAALAAVPLGAPPPDLAVNLHGTGPQSTARLAQLHPGALWSYGEPGAPPQDADDHEVRRWCRLLSAYGVPCDPDRLELAVPDVAQPAAPGAVVLHPAASAPTRSWPVECWAAVGRQLSRSGHRVVVTGDPTTRRWRGRWPSGPGCRRGRCWRAGHPCPCSRPRSQPPRSS